MNRYRIGSLGVRNPKFPHKCSICSLMPGDYDGMRFQSYDYSRALGGLKSILDDDVPIECKVRMDPHDNRYSPFYPDVVTACEGVKLLSSVVGPERVSVSFGPIIQDTFKERSMGGYMNKLVTIARACEGRAYQVIINGCDIDETVHKRLLGVRPLFGYEAKELARGVKELAKQVSIPIVTDDPVIASAGVKLGLDFDITRFADANGRVTSKSGMVQMQDIGAYDTDLWDDRLSSHNKGLKLRSRDGRYEFARDFDLDSMFCGSDLGADDVLKPSKAKRYKLEPKESVVDDVEGDAF